ncbi:MAG TPA: dephospho-CoA kinase [Planctomycetota bacterium]|nr:dephospho-CoA kinase [Planctomycetota bacterium]
MTRRSKVVGLLGGIGSGKSAVASLFEKRGARTVDADRVAHGVLEEPSVRRTLASWWGPGILRRGRVDRAGVARRVFGSAAEAARLEALVHPRIRRALKSEISRARRRGGVLIVEAALLLETGSDAGCDVLVFVDAPAAVRRRRVAARGWTVGEWRRRERAQWPLGRKRIKADYVINNGGSKAATRKQVDSILQEIARL